MNKFAVAALSFAAGGLAGFLVGYFITIEKEEGEREVVTAADLKAKEKEDVESKKPEVEKPENVVEISSNEAPTDEDEDDPYSKLVSSGPARIARPGQNGVNYSKVREIVVKNGYTDPEDIEAVINDPDNEETYEERLEREAIEDSEAMAEYRRKNKDKIVPIPHDEWDTDFPESTDEARKAAAREWARNYVLLPEEDLQGEWTRGLTDETWDHRQIVQYTLMTPDWEISLWLYPNSMRYRSAVFYSRKWFNETPKTYTT